MQREGANGPAGAAPETCDIDAGGFLDDYPLLKAVAPVAVLTLMVGVGMVAVSQC